MARTLAKYLLAVFVGWYVAPTIDRHMPYCPYWKPFGIRDLPTPDIGISCWGVHWYTPDEPKGFWSSSVNLRPPQVHWDYHSHAWSDVLKDDRAWNYNDPAAKLWRAQFEHIKEADDQKSVTWPNW